MKEHSDRMNRIDEDIEDVRTFIIKSNNERAGSLNSVNDRLRYLEVRVYAICTICSVVVPAVIRFIFN